MDFLRASICFIIISLLVYPCFAKETPDIPKQLTPWLDWVLYGHEEAYQCIPNYDDSSQLRCSWPTRLQLSINNSGGAFEQQWLVNYESWITLPGNDFNWPENIEVNKEEIVVLKKENRPKIKLKKGNYKITGEFKWNQMPEYLRVPDDSALVVLRMNDKIIDFPNIDNQGRLWLKAGKQREEKIENRLEIQSFRLIDDKIPSRIVLFLRLDASGSAREIILGPSFSPEKFIPVSLNSSLPARVEPDGRIRIQIRPGQWSLTFTVRYAGPGPMSFFTFDKPEDGFWPDEEIWVFSARNNLRIVEVQEGISIDPSQTSLPENWREYPAYRIAADETVKFKEIKRGDPHPAPDQLSLERNLWLRFDGTGYTIEDKISGNKNTNWRLEMNSPIKLGKVSVDGKEQFITRREGTDKDGIELRKGRMQLSAESEYFGSISKIPLTGWDHDFQQVNSTLFLPPGYRVLSAGGMDNIPDTWLTRWTLLDLFLVLVFTIAVAKLYSKSFSVTAFITLVLLYHEPGAPRWVWLAIIVGVALIRHLPDGRFKRMVKTYHVLAAVALISISIPFAVNQIRTGIYPQLEKPWKSMATSSSNHQPAHPATKKAEKQMTARVDHIGKRDAENLAQFEDKAAGAFGKRVKSKVNYYRGKSKVAQYDPGMINQTGPGLPLWQWNSISIKTGPVQRGQEIRLSLIGPGTNLVLSFLRVCLLILLAAGIFGIRYQKAGGWQYPHVKIILFIAFIMSAFSFFMPANSYANEIPSPAMLEELRNRFLEKDDCFPNCADILSMHIDISPDELQIKMEVNSKIDVAFPLPGTAKHWLPKEILIDKKNVTALFKYRGEFRVLVPAGKHDLILKGKLPKYNTIQLPLPVKPHRVEIEQTGWTSEGVHEDGTIDNQIQFKRITGSDSIANQILDTGILPPFVLIERKLFLGLVWKIETSVQRLSPSGSAIVLNIPLVQGESVITDGVKVNQGMAQVNLDSRTNRIQWTSVIDKTDEIILKHAKTSRWTEIWQVDVSPVFHMEYKGIPVIFHQQGRRWNPRWHPWPGEEVKFTITRPRGVQGQTLTIEKSNLEIRPGKRTTDSKLTLLIQSSQGGRHTITIPEDAQLQEVKINGKVQPVRQKKRDVTLPIIPGFQKIILQWRVKKGMSTYFKTPEINLNIRNVNSNIDVYMPHNRWPLFFFGPRLGPAVLFWSIIIMIIVTAFGLSKTGLTPLKFRHWFLLGIGMSQSNIIGILMVAGWLIALDLRKKATSDMDKQAFDFMQIGIGCITILAAGALITAISQGLLGSPDMNIAGNGSTRNLLRWYQDVGMKQLPQANIISIPMLYYRLLMLAWALWVSFYLIKIIKWGWTNFTHPAIWYSLPKKAKTKDKTTENNGAVDTKNITIEKL